jgi:potassium-transporting ATPase KdpC subunit
MIAQLGTSLRMTVVTVVALGLLYPLAMTGVAGAIFPRQAGGSLVFLNGRAIGSSEIGQLWTQARYFQGRPSAAGKGYDPTATGGTNLGPTSAKLMTATKKQVQQLERDNPHAPGAPPIDLVTSSGSGIDPDLSPEDAYWQVPRVAAARHFSEGDVRAIVARYIRGRDLGLFGEPHVNVLELNLALDARH